MVSRLRVVFEDFGPLWAFRLQSNILFLGFTSFYHSRWRSTPKHSGVVLCLGADECDIRASAVLVEMIDSVLEISFPERVFYRGFLVPEESWFLYTIFIVLEN